MYIKKQNKNKSTPAMVTQNREESHWTGPSSRRSEGSMPHIRQLGP